MSSTTIYFDESGNTGTELLDAQQTYFTTGSTDVADDEAAEIIARCFPGQKASELKSREILRRPKGRKGFLEFASEIGRQPDRYYTTVINKRFTVLCKMVDNLVEPMMYEAGYDFYEGDYATRYANMAYFAFENFLPSEASTAMYASYNDFARSPSEELLGRLYRVLIETRRNAPDGTEMFLEQMIEGVARLRTDGIGLVPDTNDIHVTSLLASMGHWQSRHTGPFKVIHDESTHFFTRERRWAEMTDPRQPPQTIVVGEKTLRLPISVTATTSASSHECASLQLCDLIAGFVSRAYASRDAEFRRFAQTALDAGFIRLGVFPVDAGSDFVEGPPEMASGLDAVDRIRMGIAAVRNADD